MSVADKAIKLRPDTRAGIEFQGLTGIAAVALNGGRPGEPPRQRAVTTPQTLNASPPSTQDVTQGAREVLQRIDDFIEENRTAFRSTLQNIDTFSAALARNSKRLDNILAGVENFTGDGKDKAGDLAATTQSIRDLAQEVGQLLIKFTRAT